MTPTTTGATTPRVTTPRATTTETIGAAFVCTAASNPGRDALADGTDTLSYAELDAATNRITRALGDRGLALGDRIGVNLDGSLALYQPERVNALVAGAPR
jgi:non-ribosomal peptide synthetase component E (peptide arylation enzyme)